jgi:hypothetical protein
MSRMNERVVATRQRVSNPDWLVPNGAENRLQIDFEIDADSYPELPYYMTDVTQVDCL